MTRLEILAYIKNGDLLNFRWYEEMFTIPILGEDYEYYIYTESKESGKYNPTIDLMPVDTIVGSSISLSGRDTPLMLSDMIELDVGDLNVVVKGMYSVSDIILNYLLVVFPFSKDGMTTNVIPFKNNLSYELVEDYIAYNLGDSVTVEQYESFVASTDLISQMAELFVVSSTDKSIGPAPGIKELRDKLFKEYRAKYGDKVDTDIRYVVEIEKLLVEYDRDYIKDDPTYGVIITEKVLANARKNLYGTMGAEIGMDGKMTPIVENSLSDGYPESNKELASLYNSSRKGSIMRGHMTQYTGADAKVTSRVLNSITIIPGDCGTKDTLSITITKDNHKEYIFYYILDSGKLVLLTKDNIESYIGKTVGLRTYTFCKEKDNKFCSTCSGKQGEDNKKIAITLSTENNSIFTNSSMKAMHDRTLQLVEYDLNVAIF